MCYTTGSCYAFSVGLCWELEIYINMYLLTDLCIYLPVTRSRQGTALWWARTTGRSRALAAAAAAAMIVVAFFIWVLEDARGSLLVGVPYLPGRLALVTDIIKDLTSVDCQCYCGQWRWTLKTTLTHHLRVIFQMCLDSPRSSISRHCLLGCSEAVCPSCILPCQVYFLL